MTQSQVKAAMLADGIVGVVNQQSDETPNLLLNTQSLIYQSTEAMDTTPVLPTVSPAPSPAPTDFPKTTCTSTLNGCFQDYECCSGGCWLKNFGVGFCSAW